MYNESFRTRSHSSAIRKLKIPQIEMKPPSNFVETMSQYTTTIVLYCTYSTYVPYSLSPYRVLNSDTASALTFLSRHIVISPLSIVSYPLAC